MSSDFMTRRSMLAVLAAAAGAGPAIAAQLGGKKKDDKKPATPAAPPPANSSTNPLARLLTQGDKKDQSLTTTLTIQAFNELDSRGVPVIGKIRFDTAAILFPVIKGCASSMTDLSKVTSELQFNDAVVSRKIDDFKEYQSGAQFARWEMKDKSGSQVELKIVIPMTSWETRFDEKTAMGVKWPAGGKYPPAAASTLMPDPLADANGNRINDPLAPEIVDLLKRWTGNKDPKTLPPVQLAKFLLGKVCEHVQTSGDGLRYGDLGAFEGFDLQASAITAKTGKCAEHDMANFLVTMYRAAGLPARTVIGYNNDDGKEDKRKFLQRKRGPQALRSWVEFALFDENGKQELWVPVDPFSQRKSGTRMPPLDRTWEFFGSIEDLSVTLPFAFQYHPPTTVVAHGHPCFWGWLTTPELQVAEQKLLFTASSTSKRGGEQKDMPDSSNPTTPSNPSNPSKTPTKPPPKKGP